MALATLLSPTIPDKPGILETDGGILLYEPAPVLPGHVPRVPLYYDDLAQIVGRLIRERNRDGWPVTEKQLRAVVDGFRPLYYRIVPTAPIPGLLADSAIIVEDTGDEVRNWGIVIHELAEHLLRSGHVPEYRLPATDGLAADAISNLVQQEYETVLRFYRRGEALTRKVREKRRRRPDLSQMALSYEAEEDGQAAERPGDGHGPGWDEYIEDENKEAGFVVPPSYPYQRERSDG